MKKFLQILGALVYSAIASYLLWLFYYWITPYLMGINSWWLYIILLLFVEPLFIGLVTTLTSLLYLPLLPLTKENTIAKFIQIPVFLFMGYCAIKLPYGLDFDYTAIKWAIAIPLSINVLISYIGTMCIPFMNKDEE